MWNQAHNNDPGNVCWLNKGMNELMNFLTHLYEMSAICKDLFWVAFRAQIFMVSRNLQIATEDELLQIFIPQGSKS